MRSSILVATALVAALLSIMSATPAPAVVVDGHVVRPVTTYSIIARDPETGELGVAVQSHWFSVGATVPWVRAGVGAVATQSLTDVSYGPLALEMLLHGKTAEQALRGLVRSDDTPQWRQVGVIDAQGNVAVHTGRKCIRQAGYVKGDNFICMANLMEKSTVWEAMAKAFRNTDGDLAEKMLAALDAAQAEGGDIRGRQSAAIVIVTGKPTGVSYKDRLVDLRVEDHPQPVKELRRLVAINRAYKFMNEGDEHLAENDAEAALEAYSHAMRLAPDITEIKFWSALTLFTSGREKDALEYFREVFEKDKTWVEVIRRLPKADLLENNKGQVARILSVAPEE